jgi:hypothetical protein
MLCSGILLTRSLLTQGGPGVFACLALVLKADNILYQFRTGGGFFNSDTGLKYTFTGF